MGIRARLNTGDINLGQAPNNNLQSKQISRIVDLLCEGEIEGYPSARNYTRGTDQYNRALLKDIYLDNTPLVNPSADPSTDYQESDKNFKGVSVSPRYGTVDANGKNTQTYLTELGNDTESEVSVNAQCVGWVYPAQVPIPVVRTITDTDIDQVRITMSIPGLSSLNPREGEKGTFLDIKIEVQVGTSNAYETIVDNDRVQGHTSNLYQRDYLIDILSTARPINIRVTKTGEWDSGLVGQNTVVANLFWASYTKIIKSKTVYPHSALVGLKFDSQQFSNIPNRTYRIRGLKVKIPSNATVDSAKGFLVYTGVWDGTLSATKKWTTCPVWILYDLLTSSRYGFGVQVAAEQLDLPSFYAASAYANTLVADGNGGQEPRFACNVNIQTQDEAYKLINDLCSVFRAMPYWSAGSIEFAQDRPTDATYIFNQSNVTEEGFSYSGSSLKTRHTVIGVKYFDMEARDHAYEVVEDAALIGKYGMVKTEIEAFACTSRGQARRVGRWMLYEEANTTEVVSFKTGIAAGQYIRPGSVIKVMDPVRAGRVRGGRVHQTNSATSVVIDRFDYDLFTGSVPAVLIFQVVLPDQTVQVINNATVNGNVVTLPQSLRELPTAGAPWMITVPSVLEGQPFRVLSITEEDGATYAITGIKYDYSKYDYVERDVPLAPRDITDLNEPPATPTGLIASEILYESNGQVLSKLLVSWAPQQNITRFVFRYRYANGNWTTIFTNSPDYEITNSDVGAYSFELQAENSILNNNVKRSGTATLTYNAIGKTAPPETIPDLFIAPIDQHTAELYWPQSVDLDVRIGGKIRIRHTPLMDGTATWGKANDITPAVAGSSTRKIVPLLEGTYFIRAVDSLGNESAGTASVVVDLPAPQDLLLVQTYRDDDNTPPFNGTATDMVYSEDELGLILSATTLIDDMATDGDWDALGSIDYIGGASPEGTYVFSETLDLGAVYDLGLERILKTRAFEPGNTWDERLENIDLWDDIDGDDLGAANCEVYVRTTTDNPSGSPTWREWQPFVNNTQRGRGFQFKMIATSVNPAQNVVVEQLGVETHLERRTEQQRNLSSGGSGYGVVFPTPFYAAPSVGITAQNMGTGDYFQIGTVTRTGFTVTFRDSSGSIVSKTFDYQAVGHGREIT